MEIHNTDFKEEKSQKHFNVKCNSLPQTKFVWVACEGETIDATQPMLRI